jgi:hypothetical protein
MKTIAKTPPTSRRPPRLRGCGTHAAPAAPEAATWAPEPERANGNGNGVSRRPAAPKVSQAKLDYAASLLRELWAGDEATAEELIADLVRYDSEHVSRLIDNISRSSRSPRARRDS